MSESISNLLIRNLRDVFGENDPAVGAQPSTRSSPKIACSTTPKAAPIADATRSIASRALLRLLTLTFATNQLPSPRNWAMPDGFDGYLVLLGKPPAYAGTDFIVARDGRIAVVYLFFDKLP